MIPGRWKRRAAVVAQRLIEAVPASDFNLAHLKAVHRHLFQDIYDWAGEVRTVEIAKDGSRFQSRRFIEAGMAGPILGDVNHVHPFPDGNGRTQLQCLKQLAQGAGPHAPGPRRLDGRLAAVDRGRSRGHGAVHPPGARVMPHTRSGIRYGTGLASNANIR